MNLEKLLETAAWLCEEGFEKKENGFAFRQGSTVWLKDIKITNIRETTTFNYGTNEEEKIVVCSIDIKSMSCDGDGEETTRTYSSTKVVFNKEELEVLLKTY